jgi:hypothetical protein
MQAWAVSLHQLPVEQSASTLQPPVGSHVPATLQAAPGRQTVPEVSVVHGPSPVAKPHLLSVVSQTALTHATVPATKVQEPVRGGVCPVTVGTGWPFTTLGAHVDAGVLQYWLVVQSASMLHPPAGMQTPALGLHTPDWQTVAPLTGVHGPSPLA